MLLVPCFQGSQGHYPEAPLLIERRLCLGRVHKCCHPKCPPRMGITERDRTSCFSLEVCLVLGNTGSAVRDFQSSQTGAVRWSLVLCISLLSACWRRQLYAVLLGERCVPSCCTPLTHFAFSVGFGRGRTKTNKFSVPSIGHLKCMESSHFVVSVTS